MSFSVDDLVSSLSGSHISQEANDIAILQAQLAKSLVGGSGSTSRGGPSRGLQNRCNTPMARTRASSFINWNGPVSQRLTVDIDMEEDERMVEELLIPSSPATSSSSNHFFKSSTPHFSTPFMPSSPVSSSFQNNYITMTSSSQSLPIDPSSIFTSTDPFYMAQLQASQSFNNSTPQSIFSQNGHISQSSPFAQSQYHHHHQNWDSQPVAMTCTAAF